MESSYIIACNIEKGFLGKIPFYNTILCATIQLFLLLQVIEKLCDIILSNDSFVIPFHTDFVHQFQELLEQYELEERRRQAAAAAAASLQASSGAASATSAGSSTVSGHPPHFTQTLVSAVAADGDSARFEAVVTGWPAPTVELVIHFRVYLKGHVFVIDSIIFLIEKKNSSTNPKCSDSLHKCVS